MEQAIPAKRVHLEQEAVLVGRGDGAGLEIDRDRIGFGIGNRPRLHHSGPQEFGDLSASVRIVSRYRRACGGLFRRGY